MCGRLVTGKAEKISLYLRLLPYDGPAFESYNVKPTERVPIVRTPGRLETARWDLVPSWWSKPVKTKPIAFNARVETVMTKPFFRGLVKTKRCLVVGQGFYEWKGEKKSKTAFFVHAANGDEVQTFAGLWDEHADPDTGEVSTSCAVLTGPAAGMMLELKDRTPLLVPAAKRAMWLDPEVDAMTALAALSSEDSAAAWTAHAVAPLKTSSEGVAMIAPVAGVADASARKTTNGSAQGSLF